MRKIFNWLIEGMSWFLTFLSPFLFSIFMSYIVYTYIFNSIYLVVLIILIGIVLGVLLAERKRKKYGSSIYRGKIFETKDIEKDIQE